MAKTVELDEGEYNNLMALRGVAARIISKPESRRLLEQAQKMVDPNAATPFLDQEAAQMAPVRELEKSVNDRIARFEKEQEDKKREDTLTAIAQRQTAGLAQLRRAGYTDEGVAAVQKLMEDKGLLDVEDAVAIFERANPPQMPSTPQGGMTGTSWGFADVNADSDKAIQELISSKGANDSVADRMAAAALQDFRSRR